MMMNEESIQKIAAACLEQGCSPEYLLGLQSDPGCSPQIKSEKLSSCLKEVESKRLPEAIQSVLPEAQRSQKLSEFIGKVLRAKKLDCFGLTGEDLIALAHWDISLTWLLFGLGNMSSCILDIPQDAIKISPSAPDGEFVRLKYGLSAADALWFFGARSPYPKDTAASRVLVRVLRAFPVTQILPEPGDILSTYARLQKNISDLVLDASADPWMVSAVEQMQKNPYKVRLLLLANQAQFSFWKLKNRLPTAGTLKLSYILERQLNKFGSQALIGYLRLLHAEAIHQGFSGFDQVVSEGAWKREKKAS